MSSNPSQDLNNTKTKEVKNSVNINDTPNLIECSSESISSKLVISLQDVSTDSSEKCIKGLDWDNDTIEVPSNLVPHRFDISLTNIKESFDSRYSEDNEDDIPLDYEKDEIATGQSKEKDVNVGFIEAVVPEKDLGADEIQNNIDGLTTNLPGAHDIASTVPFSVGTDKKKTKEERKKEREKKKEEDMMKKYKLEQVAMQTASAKSKCGRWSKHNLKIGEGGYKFVYRGYDRQESLNVAWCEFKKVHVDTKEKRQAMFRETEIMLKLDHPHIVRCFSVFHEWVMLEDPNTPMDVKGLVIIQEIMGEGTLKSVIRKNFHEGKCILKFQLITRWWHQILDALRYMHCTMQPPILHRDLKAENCFLYGQADDEYLNVKVGDFGLATQVTETTGRKTMLGTLGFMAPEIFDEKYDESVDIYAFGMLMLEVMTNKTPYDECETVIQVAAKTMTGRGPRVLQMIEDPGVKEVIMACIHPLACFRPTADELYQHPLFQLKPHPVEVEPNYDKESDRAEVINRFIKSLAGENRNPNFNLRLRFHDKKILQELGLDDGESLEFDLDIYKAEDQDIPDLINNLRNEYEDKISRVFSQRNVVPQLDRLFASIRLQMQYLVKTLLGTRWNDILFSLEEAQKENKEDDSDDDLTLNNFTMISSYKAKWAKAKKLFEKEIHAYRLQTDNPTGAASALTVPPTSAKNPLPDAIEKKASAAMTTCSGPVGCQSSPQVVQTTTANTPQTVKMSLSPAKIETTSAPVSSQQSMLPSQTQQFMPQMQQQQQMQGFPPQQQIQHFLQQQNPQQMPGFPQQQQMQGMPTQQQMQNFLSQPQQQLQSQQHQIQGLPPQGISIPSSTAIQSLPPNGFPYPFQLQNPFGNPMQPPGHYSLPNQNVPNTQTFQYSPNHPLPFTPQSVGGPLPSSSFIYPTTLQPPIQPQNVSPSTRSLTSPVPPAPTPVDQQSLPPLLPIERASSEFESVSTRCRSSSQPPLRSVSVEESMSVAAQKQSTNPRSPVDLQNKPGTQPTGATIHQSKAYDPTSQSDDTEKPSSRFEVERVSGQDLLHPVSTMAQSHSAVDLTAISAHGISSNTATMDPHMSGMKAERRTRKKSRIKGRFLLRITEMQEGHDADTLRLTFFMQVPNGPQGTWKLTFRCNLSDKVEKFKIPFEGLGNPSQDNSEIDRALKETVNMIFTSLYQDPKSIAINEDYIFFPVPINLDAAKFEIHSAASAGSGMDDDFTPPICTGPGLVASVAPSLNTDSPPIPITIPSLDKAPVSSLSQSSVLHDPQSESTESKFDLVPNTVYQLKSETFVYEEPPSKEPLFDSTQHKENKSKLPITVTSSLPEFKEAIFDKASIFTVTTVKNSLPTDDKCSAGVANEINDVSSKNIVPNLSTLKPLVPVTTGGPELLPSDTIDVKVRDCLPTTETQPDSSKPADNVESTCALAASSPKKDDLLNKSTNPGGSVRPTTIHFDTTAIKSNYNGPTSPYSYCSSPGNALNGQSILSSPDSTSYSTAFDETEPFTPDVTLPQGFTFLDQSGPSGPEVEANVESTPGTLHNADMSCPNPVRCPDQMSDERCGQCTSASLANIHVCVPAGLEGVIGEIANKMCQNKRLTLVVVPSFTSETGRPRVLEVPEHNIFIGVPKRNNAGFSVIKGPKEKSFVIAQESHKNGESTPRIYQAPAEGAVILSPSGEIQYVERPTVIVPPTSATLGEGAHPATTIRVKELPMCLEDSDNLTFDDVIQLMQFLKNITPGVPNCRASTPPAPTNPLTTNSDHLLTANKAAAVADKLSTSGAKPPQVQVPPSTEPPITHAQSLLPSSTEPRSTNLQHQYQNLPPAADLQHRPLQMYPPLQTQNCIGPYIHGGQCHPQQTPLPAPSQTSQAYTLEQQAAFGSFVYPPNFPMPPNPTLYYGQGFLPSMISPMYYQQHMPSQLTPNAYQSAPIPSENMSGSLLANIGSLSVHSIDSFSVSKGNDQGSQSKSPLTTRVAAVDPVAQTNTDLPSSSQPQPPGNRFLIESVIPEAFVTKASSYFENKPNQGCNISSVAELTSNKTPPSNDNQNNYGNVLGAHLAPYNFTSYDSDSSSSSLFDSPFTSVSRLPFRSYPTNLSTATNSAGAIGPADVKPSTSDYVMAPRAHLPVSLSSPAMTSGDSKSFSNPPTTPSKLVGRFVISQPLNVESKPSLSDDPRVKKHSHT